MNKFLLVTGIALLAGAVFWHSSPKLTAQDFVPEEYAAKFSQFKQDYNKKYASSSEDSFRLAVFYANTLEAEVHNANPEATWTMGTTQFSDLTQEEFAATYLTLKTEEFDGVEGAYEDNEFVPNGAVDWRKEAGVATKVKNQGQCGSCWAFSTIGAVEAYYAKVKGQKNLDLSEQQIVDCSKSGNQGCNGGWPRVALQWVAQHGVTTQAAYPYTARDGTCKTQSGAYKIGGPQKVTANQASHQSAISQRPVSVCVDASNWSQYRGGILSTCGTSTNHAVTAFGYDNGFWLIKNSWGTQWGEGGYIRIKDGNTCNVLSESYLAA